MSIPYVLTDADRSQAALIALTLERNRRRQNEADADRARRAEELELFRALESTP